MIAKLVPSKQKPIVKTKINLSKAVIGVYNKKVKPLTLKVESKK